MKRRPHFSCAPIPSPEPLTIAAAGKLSRPSSTTHTVKIFLLTLILLAFLTSPETPLAQVQMPALPAPGPRITREEAIQRALERAAAAQAAASNAQARATNAPAAILPPTISSPRPVGPTPPTMRPTPTTVGPTPTAVGPIPATVGPIPTTVGPIPATVGPIPATVGPIPTTVGPTPTSAIPAPTNASSLITNRTVRTAVPTATAAGGFPNAARPAVAGQPAVPGGGFPAAQVPPITLPKPGAAATAAPSATPSSNAAEKPESELFPPGLIKFQDADLVQVLDVYQELTGRTVLRPTSLPTAKVTIRSQTPLTRKEAIQALDSILSMNQITMVPQGEKFVKAVPFSQAPTEGAAFSKLRGEDLPEAGVYTTHVVQVKNAVITDIAQALQPFSKMPQSILAIPSSSIIILRDYAENVKRMLEVLEKIDVVPVSDFDSVVIPIKYALAGDIATVLGSLTAGGGGGVTSVGTRPQTERRGLTSPGIGLGGAGGAGGAGGYGNQSGYNQNAGGATGLGGQTGSRSGFQDRLRNIVNKAASAGDITVLGQTKIISDERTNSLLIYASKADIATIRDIISKLDVVLAQVLIEAIIMEVKLGDDLRYGVSYLQRSPSQGGNYYSGIGAIRNNSFLNPGSFGAATNLAGALPGGFSYFGRFGSDFEATATAIATDNRIHVLSRPRIQTSHAVTARIFVGESRPYITGTYGGGGGIGGYGQSSQYSQLRIGIDLNVTPLINVDGLVVMDIEQQINSVGGNVKIDNNDVPITVERTASAKVSVKDGDTIILGGFISNDRTKSSSGVPILKDIPILGGLFRTTSDNKNRQELIVLIRPTVLPTPGDAAMAAMVERSKMPGISQIEREEAKNERASRAKAARMLLKREGLED